MVANTHLLEKVVVAPNLKYTLTRQIGQIYLALVSIRKLKIDTIAREILN